jgi:membrane protein YdbS with pleckstrin-like domain
VTELPEPDNRLPPEARKYWRVSGALSSLPVIAVAVWVGSVVPDIRLLLILGALAVAAVAIAIAPGLRYRRWRYAIREHEIDISHGTWVSRRTLVPMRRVQHVDTESGPLQGSFGLASVSFHTAAGGLEIPALRQAEANRVRGRIGELAAAERGDGPA